tara:strand:- start:2060 stop:3307 length:1248 start_codon:yes stop_codon:yes gene_type:complete
MAKFSQQFLANLGRPQMAESLFGLGATIGGLPGQAKDQRKKQEFNQLMQQIQGAQGSKDFTSMKILAQQLATIDPQQADKVMQAALAGEVKQQQTQEETQGTRAGAQMLMTELQDYASDPTIPEPLRRQSENFLRAAATAGDRASLLEPRVQELRKLITETAKPVSLSAGAALVSPATGEVLYERPFKPTAAAKPTIKVIKGDKDDPNIRVFTDGKLTETISTVPAGRALEEQEMDNARISQIVRIKGDLTELMDPEGKYSGWTTSGVTGQILGNFWGGSTAYDRNSLMESVKASLGLEAIAALKKASKQGATGLGQVSNLELRALQSEIATLNIAQSADAQQASLQKIFNHLDRIQQVASGVVPSDAIDWNSPEYMAAGYAKDTDTGSIFYAPEGPQGTKYKFIDGRFQEINID